MSSIVDTTSHMRRDVARHRIKILQAARRIFAEKGLEAPLEDVIIEAEVGRATLYRHFANRMQLVNALLTENLDMLAGLAAELKHQPDAILTLLETMVKQVADLAPLMGARLPDQQRVALRERYVAVCEGALATAHLAGLVRTDLLGDDILDLALMASAVLTGLPPDRRRAKAHHVYVLLTEGIRTRRTSAFV